MSRIVLESCERVELKKVISSNGSGDGRPVPAGKYIVRSQGREYTILWPEEEPPHNGGHLIATPTFLSHLRSGLARFVRG